MSDTWDKIKNIVIGVAPILGNAIVPGSGGAAGALLAKVLNCDVTKPKTIEEKLLINVTVNQIKLKELENNHEEFLMEICAENDKLILADIQNARQREIKLASNKSSLNIPMYILGIIIVVGFFGLLTILLRKEVPPDNIRMLDIMFGCLVTCFTSVVQYFYGSSRGSSEKNDAITKLKNISGQ